jgi:cytosine permease
MVGGVLGDGLPLAGVFFCIVVGGLILLACVCFTGIRSSVLGLPSTVVSAEGLGRLGARYISALLITITSVGWFGVQAIICGASFSVITAEALGVSIPVQGAALFLGGVITVSAMYGYQLLKHFYYIITPVLFIVLVYMSLKTVFFSEAGSVAALLAWRPEQPMSYMRGITLVVGTWAMGTFTGGDYCRYAINPYAAILGLSVGLLLAIPLVFSGGAIFRILQGTPDITVLLVEGRFPAVALIFIVLAAWSLNMVNAYSGGIALSVLLGLPEKRMRLSTALVGGIGTVLGAAGILSRFTDFLSLLSSLVPPVIGVLIGAEIVKALRHRESKNADILTRGNDAAGNTVIPGKSAVSWGSFVKSGFHIPGVIAYGAGALTAWLTTAVRPFFIPPLNGILIAALVYSISDRFLPEKEEKS